MAAMWQRSIVDKKMKLDFLFKLSNPNSNFALTLGFLNLALNIRDHGKKPGSFDY